MTTPYNLVRGASVALLLGMIAAPATAQSAGGDDGYILTVGGGVRTGPDFPGADEQQLGLWPVFSIRKVGEEEPFEAAEEGLAIGIVDVDGFSIGPVVSLARGRDAEDIPGLREVDRTIELGAFVQYFPVRHVRLRADLRQGVNGHEGLTGEAAADYIIGLDGPARLGVGPRLRFGDDGYVSSFFDVDRAGSLASGLPVYDADGGLHAAGVAANGRFMLGGPWSLHAFARYDRLIGDAADSPVARIVGSRDQYFAGIGVAYSFRID